MSRNKDPRKMCRFHRLMLAHRCANCAEKGPHRLAAALDVLDALGLPEFLCQNVPAPEPAQCPNCKAGTPLPSLDRRPVVRRRGKQR